MLNFPICLYKRLMLLLCITMISTASYAYNPYSTKELEELEKEFIQQINQSDLVVRHALASQYINRLGARLAQVASMPSPYFFIVRSNEVNAFAGPGGFIGVNTQLILATDTESELAGVMAHELAHVRLHHLYAMIEHQKQMRVPMLASLLASLALGVINPVLANGALMATITGLSQDNINFTRAKEKEADRIGINMLIRANFDARAMARFFKKMQETTRYYYTANVPAILRSHPLDDDRIAEAENRSWQLKQKGVQSSEDFIYFKELIRVAANEDSQRLLNYYRQSCPHKVACDYGEALIYLSLNQFEAAKRKAERLIEQDPNNLYFKLALIEANIGVKNLGEVYKQLDDLKTNNPDNYAVLIAYSRGMRAIKKPELAVRALIPGRRQYKTDLPLCQELAEAASEVPNKAFAYFTEAQCELLQGHKAAALRQLKLVKEMSKHDAYLKARAEAMIEEILSNA